MTFQNLGRLCCGRGSFCAHGLALNGQPPVTPAGVAGARSPGVQTRRHVAALAACRGFEDSAPATRPGPHAPRANFTSPLAMTAWALPRTFRPANGQFRLFDLNSLGSMVHSDLES